MFCEYFNLMYDRPMWISFFLSFAVAQIALAGDPPVSDSCVSGAEAIAKNATFGIDIIFFRDAARDQVANCEKKMGIVLNIPKKATNVFVQYSSMGGGEFHRYKTSNLDFLDACGEFCTSRHKMTKFPKLWPRRSDEVDIPEWVEVPQSAKKWLSLKLTPHYVTVNGEQKPCGYKNVEAKLFSFDRRSQTAFMMNLSKQWYLTGCET